jgi:uncharacterized radical SAM protein YgiQ
MDDLGWDRCDVVLISGDAYVDHPAFGAALIGRFLENLGHRVGVIPQPDWSDSRAFLALGQPRLFVGISSGAMDSMVNHYTAMKRLRSNDDYSEGGRPGRRPDRALLVYANRVQQAMPGVPVVLGGVEASLRRVTHYDFWSDRLRKSVLLDAKAAILVYGMGERAVGEIARRLDAGLGLEGIRGTAVFRDASTFDPAQYAPAVRLPSHEEIVASGTALLEATRILEKEANPYNARTLVQGSDRRVVILFPPAAPLATEEMDALYALPFARRPHPRYQEEIPAFTMIRHSITAVRGCAGGCSFCALSLHQGRAIQSRSQDSILTEVRTWQATGFGGIISDVGGPTANLYGLGCRDAAAQARCRRSSCLHPRICPSFQTDQGRYVRLLRSLRHLAGVRRVFVSSGIRFDVALEDPEFLAELVGHHVSGHLKVAPEHFAPDVLRRMRKPPASLYGRFRALFEAFSRQAGKAQYLVPYLMAGFPGCTEGEMGVVERELRRHGIRPQQVQLFLPTPMTLATAMFHAGVDPRTGEEIYVARTPGERRRQLARLLYYRGAGVRHWRPGRGAPP